MTFDTRIKMGLWYLVVSGVVVGAWAQFFPQAFYETKTRETVLAASLGWLVAQVPHFTYHMIHLHVYPSMADKVGNVITLALLVLVPAYLFLRAVRGQ